MKTLNNRSTTESSSTLKESVDGKITEFHLTSDTDVSELSRTLKKDLKKGTVKLLKIISWE